MENNNIRKGYLARVKDKEIVYRSKEDIKSQLQNCFEVIRKYEEKINTNTNANQKPNSILNSNARPSKFGHRRPLGPIRTKEFLRPVGFEKKQQMEKKENKVKRTVSSMLGDITDLTTEERSRAGGMLDVLEKDKGHNRGHNRGRGR